MYAQIYVLLTHYIWDTTITERRIALVQLLKEKHGAMGLCYKVLELDHQPHNSLGDVYHERCPDMLYYNDSSGY